jgi:hypothetical protein
VLEANPESTAALLMGLDYLVNISYVEVGGAGTVGRDSGKEQSV